MAARKKLNFEKFAVETARKELSDAFNPMRWEGTNMRRQWNQNFIPGRTPETIAGSNQSSWWVVLGHMTGHSTPQQIDRVLAHSHNEARKIALRRHGGLVVDVHWMTTAFVR